MPGEDPLLRFPPEFPILEKATCLVSNSLGAIPWTTARALAESAFTGWMAHLAPFSFEPPPMRHREDAFRFQLGTPAIPAPYAAREGPRLVGQTGIGAIRDKSLRQTARAIALAERRGFRKGTPADPARRGGTASIGLPNALEVSRELNARDVVVDYRPGVGIRMSPHLYTEDRELDSAFEEIDEILETGARKRWEGRGGLLT